MSKQVSQRYNVSITKEYYTSQNEKKTQWINIGTAVQFTDGSIVQNINSLPTGNWWDGTCQLFKQEQRTTQTQGVAQQSYQPQEAQQQSYQPQTYGQYAPSDFSQSQPDAFANPKPPY